MRNGDKITQDFNEVFKKYDFSNEEIRIYNIMQKYQLVSRGNKQYITLFKKDTDPRKAKWWSAFSKFNERYKNSDIDFSLFFRAQFKNNKGKFIPNFLSSDASYNRYLSFIKEYTYTQQNIDNLIDGKKEDLKKTHQFINNFLLDNGFSENNYDAFFTYKLDFSDYISSGIKFAMQGYLSPLYLSISKSFGMAYEMLDKDICDEIITSEEIKEKRLFMIRNKELLDFSKELFGVNEINMKWNIHYSNDVREEELSYY